AHHRSQSSVFFFQAEDGIRGGHVTGVQTCALPIFDLFARGLSNDDVRTARSLGSGPCTPDASTATSRARSYGPRRSSRSRRFLRSEERRVGKECRSGGW